MGGGTAEARLSETARDGPSPRGRGNLGMDLFIGAGRGTIPAWAGEPCKALPLLCPARDHPRVGGGTAWRRLNPLRDLGPSPRGRGNRRDPAQRSPDDGTIPAWAGEPRQFSYSVAVSWDHPRVGGGTRKSRSAFQAMAGPSPRGRGNLHPMPSYVAVMRTIPAWAGEPIHRRSWWPWLRDHPRVGGGTLFLLSFEAGMQGPSPRGRGNHAAIGDRPKRHGTIPAWAGEPHRDQAIADTPRDHPRVGGGTERLMAANPDAWGPSPRGRGNP